ncbi:MAG: hypothetical protein R3203_10210 [Pseudoalteromonas tetraodonis]|nr:hypothetical protein [Pseudoalteromonas tetraodonis]
METGKKLTSKIIFGLNKNYGFYAIVDEKEEILYIGYSSCMKTRMLTHILNRLLGDKFYKDAAKIYFIASPEMDNDYDNRVQEMALINTINPRLNKINFDFKTWFYSLPKAPVANYNDYLVFANKFKKGYKNFKYIDLINLKIEL